MKLHSRFLLYIYIYIKTQPLSPLDLSLSLEKPLSFSVLHRFVSVSYRPFPQRLLNELFCVFFFVCVFFTIVAVRPLRAFVLLGELLRDFLLSVC